MTSKITIDDKVYPFNTNGLREFAGDVLGHEYLPYYERRREVDPDKPVWECGVRIKTMEL